MTQRILSLDIETSPTLAWIWSQKPDYVPLEMVERPAQMLCFGARFHDQKKTQFFSEWSEGHAGMVEAAQSLLSEADTVVHYNGLRFDSQWLDTEIKIAGLGVPSPFAQVDLFKQTLRFRLFSHKLAHVSTHLLKLEGKKETGGFGLWRKVMDDMGIVPSKYTPEITGKAKRLMQTYCVQDVDLLPRMYVDLLPWMKSIPNANLFTGKTGCPRCGGTSVVKDGFKHLTSGTYQQYRCNSCGGWSRDTHRIASTSIVSA